MEWNPFNNKKKQEEAKRLASERLVREKANQLAQEQKETKELSALLETYCSSWQSGFYTKADEINWSFSPTTLQNKYPYSPENREHDKNIMNLESSVLRMSRINTSFHSLKSWSVNKIDLGEGKILTMLNEKILGAGRDNAGRGFNHEEIVWKYGDSLKNPVSLLKNISTPPFPVNKEFTFKEFNPETNQELKELKKKEISLLLKITDSLAKGEKIWVCYDDERINFEPLISENIPCSSNEDFRDKVRNFKVSDLKYYKYAENLCNALPSSLNISIGFEMDGASIGDVRDVMQNLIFCGKERAVDQRVQGKETPVRPINGYTSLYTSKLLEPTEEDIQRFNAIHRM
ncbi:MAG: hypothetical protein V4721_06500 [Bacteroidota bacterium]